MGVFAFQLHSAWLERTLTFFSGVVAGAVLTSHFWMSHASARNRRHSMVIMDAVRLLESEDKINVHLSSAENALRILDAVLCFDLAQTVRASIIYAREVLRSDFQHSVLPVGLTFSSSDQLFSTSSIHDDVDIRDWLVLNYTPKHVNTVARPRSFRIPMPEGYTLVEKARDIMGKVPYRHSHRDQYIYDVDEAELDAINRALEGVDDWDWDVWRLTDASKGRPLQTLGWHLLHKWDLISALRLDPTVVRNWFIFVEKLYLDNAYHNATHAADVLQAVHFLLGRGGAARHLCPLALLSLLLAAAAHDAGHDGLNNLYHQHALTDRALAHNDQSIQENYHLAAVFQAMRREPRVDVLAALPAARAQEARRIMIAAVLATDMSRHFHHTQDLRALAAAAAAARGRDPAPAAPGAAGAGGAAAAAASAGAWAPADAAATDTLCVNLLHAADLSNPARPAEVGRRWAGLVLDEFFDQGDRELTEGLPVSPLCARDTTLLPASQVGFISFVVLPYFQVLGELLPAVQTTLIPHIETNLRRWRALDGSADPGPGGPGPGSATPSSPGTDSDAMSPTARSPSVSPVKAGGGGGGGGMPRVGSRLRVFPHLPTLSESPEVYSPDVASRPAAG